MDDEATKMFNDAREAGGERTPDQQEAMKAALAVKSDMLTTAAEAVYGAITNPRQPVTGAMTAMEKGHIDRQARAFAGEYRKSPESVRYLPQ